MSGHVLIIEDDPVTALLMKTRLEKEYFQTSVVDTAKEGLETLLNESVDVVILDIILPDRNGFDVCREIKAHPKLAHMPVIITTSLRDAADRLKGFEAGADEFLSKPTNEEILIARTKNLIRVKQSLDELRKRVDEASKNGVNLDYRRFLEARGRVLLVEDQFHRAHELGTMINRFADVDIELDPTAATHTASETPYDCILISFSLENVDGIRVCSQLRAVESLRSTPILAITEGEDHQDKVIRALEIGVSDYLHLPIDLSELQVRLTTQISRKKQNNQLRNTIQNEIEMAVVDELTRLHNRRYLDRRFPALIEESNQNNRPLSVLLVDVDFFKDINDRFGHDSGDKILVEMAQRLSSSLREHDILCRYGGEEFLIIMPDCNHRAAHRAAERLRKLIQSKPFLQTIYGDKIHASISIGVASKQGREQDYPALLRCADRALYTAKREGRNRVVSDAA